MRKIIILALFFCQYCGVTAQVEYYHFLKDGKMWNCKIEQSGTDAYTEYYTNIIRGDSIINGTTYYKMYRETETTSSLDFYALWREDNGKVYVHVNGENTDRLMYDFKAQPETVIVCEGQSVQINDTSEMCSHGRNYHCLSVCVSSDYFVNWVEGVGSPYGPGYPLGSQFTDGKRTELLSCYEGNKLIFDSSDFNNIYTSTDEVKKDIPARKSNFVLYDLHGRRLTDKPTKGIYIQNGRKYVVVK